MFNVRFLLYLVLMLSPFVSLAQGVAPTTSTTNPPPVTVPVTGITTNETPPVTTNAPPVVKPKSPGVVNGVSLLGAFSGSAGSKFSVSGRTLRLPDPGTLRHADDDWRRNLDFGMTTTRGNSETLRYSLGIDAVKEQENDLFRLRGKGSYGESEGVKDTENAQALFRYERLLTQRVYALGNIEWMSDSIAGLNYRLTGILSPGLRLIRSETTVVNAELGAGYIEENKDESETGWAAGRAAATVEKILNAHVLVWCTGEYLPKITDPGIFFVNAEAGIASFITRDLSLNVCYQERYDSAPVEGKENSDTVLSTALSLSF